MKEQDLPQELRNELQEHAPLLAKLKPQSGFKTPPYYFHHLTEELLGKTPKSEIQPQASPAKPRISLWEQLAQHLEQLLQPRWAVGFATVVFLGVGGFWYISQFNSGITNTTLSPDLAISADDARLYILNNLEDFEETDIALIYSSPDAATSLPDLNISPEELQDYIQDEILEDVDLNQLQELM